MQKVIAGVIAGIAIVASSAIAYHAGAASGQRAAVTQHSGYFGFHLDAAAHTFEACRAASSNDAATAFEAATGDCVHLPYAIYIGGHDAQQDFADSEVRTGYLVPYYTIRRNGVSLHDFAVCDARARKDGRIGVVNGASDGSTWTCYGEGRTTAVLK